jgi:hypothetical protein
MNKVMDAIMPDKSLCVRQRQLALRVCKHYRELGTARTVGAVGCNNVHTSPKNVRKDIYNSSEIMALLLLLQFQVTNLSVAGASVTHLFSKHRCNLCTFLLL